MIFNIETTSGFRYLLIVTSGFFLMLLFKMSPIIQKE